MFGTNRYYGSEVLIFGGNEKCGGGKGKKLGDNMKIPFRLLSKKMKLLSILIIIYTFLLHL